MAVATMHPFPDTAAVSQLLTMLIGHKPVVTPVKVLTVGGGTAGPWFAGIYTVDDAPSPCAVIAMDFPAAVGGAGAMTVTPAAILLAELKAKKPSEILTSTMHEILNVCASLLNRTGSPHVRLTRVVEWQGNMPEEVKGLFAAADQRLNLDLCFAPCPTGHMAVARCKGA